MGDGGWDAILQEWTVDTGYCYAGGLANAEDGAFYAAAPVEGEAGWGLIYADDEEKEILQEDGETKKKEMISEAATLLEALSTGRAKKGLWLGGEKYSVVQYDKEFESGDATFTTVFANRPKKGVHIVSTGSQVAVGFYDESKEQTSGNCKRVVLAFAEYLKGAGY
eukprot:gnl/MRDRNA2_/MRDRNA2_87747_c0_seq1.p1 gnl/MRDRNA2_/MRDRNA2_87747_c0~~gnl/MRDRNA2_/MRDRNA2_87747_c0_seq1.p1  ORF type:complete len:166 (-),score=48.73 gnl/MRDRNA2_/MRDRNA2_87747_c0_seq1:147-644(-)